MHSTPRGARCRSMRYPPSGHARAQGCSARESLLTPLIGRPHPLSEGEQLLAAAIGADPALHGLFEFNQWVESCFGRRFLGDLVAREERIVVEVDGYRWHSTRALFASDRARDFELVVSGYLVLRLPHEEVLRDIDAALEKVRTFVAFRRSDASLTS